MVVPKLLIVDRRLDASSASFLASITHFSSFANGHLGTCCCCCDIRFGLLDSPRPNEEGMFGVDESTPFCCMFMFLEDASCPPWLLLLLLPPPNPPCNEEYWDENKSPPPRDRSAVFGELVDASTLASDVWPWLCGPVCSIALSSSSNDPMPAAKNPNAITRTIIDESHPQRSIDISQSFFWFNPVMVMMMMMIYASIWFQLK